MRPRVTSVGLIIPPDPADYFEYPDHIDRGSLDALPPKPGVYLFRDRRGTPIYIGKSVNIRSRVQSHLRTPEEAAMLNATRTIDFLRTAGEIGALLVESQLIKNLQPAYNCLLRHIGESFAIRLETGATGAAQPRVAGSFDHDFNATGTAYGLFASRSTADAALRGLIRQHMLCPALCGLESTTRGRACFSRQIGRCSGACAGAESAAAHHARLRAALEQLQASVWPYPGPVGIVEESDGWRQTHVVDHWSYLGSLEGKRSRVRRPAKPAIDIDTYKILAKPLSAGELDIVLMNPPSTAGRTERRRK